MESQANSNKNNRRIAQNTIFLYIRQFLTMAVALYTSRVVLQALGTVDYGIYNVVGGMVTMFSFLNSSLAQATQRFIAFGIEKAVSGRGNALAKKMLEIGAWAVVVGGAITRPLEIAQRFFAAIK